MSRNKQQCAGFWSAGAFLVVFGVLALPALADSMPSFEIVAKDGRFTPSTIEAPAGKKFRLVVRNEGPGAEEFESKELNREKVIPQGKSIPIIIGPLSAGTYPFFGEFHPETAKGQIVVK